MAFRAGHQADRKMGERKISFDFVNKIRFSLDLMKCSRELLRPDFGLTIERKFKVN